MNIDYTEDKGNCLNTAVFSLSILKEKNSANY